MLVAICFMFSIVLDVKRGILWQSAWEIAGERFVLADTQCPRILQRVMRISSAIVCGAIM